MLDTSTETQTTATRWRPKLPTRRKVVGRPGGGTGNGTAPAGGGRIGKVTSASSAAVSSTIVARSPNALIVTSGD